MSLTVMILILLIITPNFLNSNYITVKTRFVLFLTCSSATVMSSSVHNYR